MWQIKYFEFPLALDQWPPNMARWQLAVRVFHPWNHIAFKHRIMWGYIWNKNYITTPMITKIGALTHRIKWSFNWVVLSHRMRLCQIKNLYLYLEKTYGHENRRGGDLPWEAPNLKVAWPQVGHLINWQNYISIFTRRMVSKHSRVLVSGRRLRT